MENVIPQSKKLLYRDAFSNKLFPLLFAVLFCYCPNTHAGIKPANRLRGRHKNNAYTPEVTTASKSIFFAAPTLSYSSPQTYTAGTTVTLTPTSSGVAALGFSSSPVTVGSGFTHPNAVAVDAAGNVYVADAGHNAVKMIPVGGGSPVSIGSGFSNPRGVALDAAGNIYVADAGHNAVKKIPVGGGSIVSIGSGFNNPLALALDVAGNVYVGDGGSQSLKMIPVGGGATVTLVGGYFEIPSGIAVDPSGTNIYIADSGPTSAGVYRVVVTKAGEGSFGSGYTKPAGISVDAVGNLLVADAGSNIIYKVPPAGTASTTLGAGLNGPTGVVQDASGNVYVADNNNNAVKKIKPTGGYFISTALPAGLNFNRSTGVISGTPTEASPAKNYVITAYNSSGSKSATVNIKVNLPPSPTISYSSPHTYTVGTAITPVAPTSSNVAAKGFSPNPVVLPPGFIFPSTVAKDAAGNVYDLDVDNNKVLKTPPGGVQAVYATLSERPNCIATDAAGNVFVGLFYENQIEKIPIGGGAHTFMNSGFNLNAIAVDPVGNLFTVVGHSPDNPNGGAVEEIFADGSGGIGLTGGDFQPFNVALDTTGNVYVQGATGFEKIKPIGGYYVSRTLPAGLTFNISTGVISGTSTKSSPATTYTITAYNNYSSKPATINIKVNGPPNVNYSSPHTYTANVAAAPLVPTSYSVAAVGYGTPAPAPPGFVFPNTTAKDGAGNVYTVDADNSKILKTPPGGTPFVYATVSEKPTCVASDAAGNLFVGLFDQFHIEKIPVGGGAHVILNAGFDAFGIAIDPAGNLFIADGHSPDNFFGGAVEEYRTDGSSVMLADGSNVPQNIAVDTAGNVYVLGLAIQKITPTGGYYISASLPAGLSFSNATGIISGTPTVAGPAKSYTITAYNSFGSSPATLIIKVLSKNNNLASLIISKGTLAPTFNMNITSYTASVGNTIEGISVTPTTANPASTVTVNGTPITSGSTTPSLQLFVGSNTISTVVTAENGATKTYTLMVTRAASTLALPADAYASGNLSAQVLTLYPNPNPGNQLNIVLKNYRKQASVTIYLYNIAGSKIKTFNIQTDVQGNYNTAIPIASVGSPKLYIIRTISDSVVKEGKVLVN